ncbi:MAG: phage tail protein [Cyanobacteria bacterium P01_A01_bin.123]
MRDVNDTRYHLFLGRSDWEERSLLERGQGRRWEYDEAREGIRLQAEIFTFQQSGAIALDPTQRRDSDRDVYGHWYWIEVIEQENEIRTQIHARWAEATAPEVLFPRPAAECLNSSPSRPFRPAAPSSATREERLAGLAVMREGYLVVGSPSTGSLLAFDLYALDNAYLRLPLPPAAGGEPAAPFDLAALPDGGLLVLDRQHRQLWRLDQRLRLLPVQPRTAAVFTPFQPKSGAPRRSRSATLPSAILLTETTNPIALAPLPDGSFWLLDQPDSGAAILWHYDREGQNPRSLTLLISNLVEAEADDLNLGQIRGYDLTYVPDRDLRGRFLATGTLFVVDQSGNQAYGLRLASLEPLQLRIERRYYPLRQLDTVSFVATWSEGEAYYLQASDRWLPIKALPRQRYETEATLTLAALDGKEPGCLWHRLCIDACLPPETALQIEARAAETIADLEWATWQRQPTPYRRPAVEVPYSNLWSEIDREDPHTGTWELLFQQLPGRYLQLRLALIGNGRSSPLVRSLRVHYPRFSYLRQYLPAVYQQDLASQTFLDQFLANPEGIFTTVEGLIAQAQTLFDVRTVPTDALDWLADWFGLALEPGWSEYQRRLLIAQAPYFFHRRGTTVGILQAILLTLYPEFGPRLFQDDVAQLCPTVRIVEQFLTRTWPGVAAGDPTDPELTLTANVQADAKARAHRFTVLLPTPLTSATETLIRRIVELEKPAHTAFTIKQYWALFRVGEVRLGWDTVLGQGGQFETFVLGQSALAEATLAAAFPYTLNNRTVLAC